MTPNTSFRIPIETKKLLQKVCAYQGKTMSQTVIDCVRRYITESVKDPVLLKHIKSLEIQEQTGLVQDDRGTWVKPETLKNEDDWRESLF